MMLLRLVLVFLAAAFSHLQSKEELEKGQKFLDKIAKSWDASPPAEKVVGMYIGRKWVGFSRVTVEKIPEGGFRLYAKYEIEFSGKKVQTESTVSLAPNMCVQKADIVTYENGKKETRTLTVDNSMWKQARDHDGKVTEQSGSVTPGMTWGAGLLLLYAIPDEQELSLVVPAAEKGTFKFKKVAEKVKLRSADCYCIEMIQGTEVSRWYFDDKWNFVELHSGPIPIKVRLVSEDKVGKNLDEPSRLNDAEKAVIHLYRCIKKNDRDLLLSCFDIPRYAEEMVPGYKEMPAEDKKTTLSELEKKICGSLLNLKNRNNLPEDTMMEDFFYDSIHSNIKGDTAEVWIEGQTPWKLYKTADGRWMICGLGSKK